MARPKDDINNYTWTDKEYYNLCQRELYNKRLGINSYLISKTYF